MQEAGPSACPLPVGSPFARPRLTAEIEAIPLNQRSRITNSSSSSSSSRSSSSSSCSSSSSRSVACPPPFSSDVLEQLGSPIHPFHTFAIVLHDCGIALVLGLGKATRDLHCMARIATQKYAVILCPQACAARRSCHPNAEMHHQQKDSRWVSGWLVAPRESNTEALL